MHLNIFIRPVSLLLFLWVSVSCSAGNNTTPQELPNILWITSEDNSPLLGCYGDDFATTPNLDSLATEGFLYTHAYANAPVCSPARNTILTGVYACSGGNQHMRSAYAKSDLVKPYPEYLRNLGYYCTNNWKTDYNYVNENANEMWDENGNKAHYKNRPEGKPFFAVFNTMLSHESSIHISTPANQLRHDPEKVTIAPYMPGTPDIKHDWAQYYDKMEEMDTWVGEILKELEDEGLTDSTIVFYYGDHGGVLGRSKRYVYETGTRVPFIVRIPEKYKHLFPAEKINSSVDRLVSFVDLVPTLLSIAGATIPEYLQGDAFLGEQKTEDPEYAYMFRGRMGNRYDMSRAVRDKKYRYIRNYMPHRIYGQYMGYLFQAPSMQSWFDAYTNGACNEIQSRFWNTKSTEELYDTENDPWEINNLADDPAYHDVLERMRSACNSWQIEIYDTGFIPESDYSQFPEGMTPYDYMRSGNVNLQEIIAAADTASMGNSKNIDKLIDFLTHDDSNVRYWGATGLLILGEDAKSAVEELKAALNDESAVVAIVAAEALYKLGEKELAKNALLDEINNSNRETRNIALNAIDGTEDHSPEVIEAVKQFLANLPAGAHYDKLTAEELVLKWENLPTDVIGLDDIGSIAVYPNPTDGYVTVAFGQLPDDNPTIRVFNYTGLLMLEKPAYSLRENINLSGQVPGIYFVNVSGANFAKALKLVLR